MSPRKAQLGKSARVAIVAMTVLLSAARVRAPIMEESPTPSATPNERATPKRTRNHEPERHSAEAPGRTPSATPKRRATPDSAAAAGTWVGRLMDIPDVGNVDMTFTVNATATAVSEAAPSLSYFRSFPATFDGATLTWTAAYNCRYTLTPRADGQTAVVTEVCPGVFLQRPYSTSTIFRRTP
jgi:hypothetical protein